DAPGDGLADPPGGVGGELEALAPVEHLDGVHQAQIALLDEVEEQQARRLVLLGDRDDQTKVGLDERALGALAILGLAAQLSPAGGLEVTAVVENGARFITGLDGLRETNLVVFSEQWVLPDIRQVEPDEVFLIPLDTLLGHACPLRVAANRPLVNVSVRREHSLRWGTRHGGVQSSPYLFGQGALPPAHAWWLGSVRPWPTR